MGLGRKISMAAVALRLGRRFEDKAELLRLCACYGGLSRFRGGHLTVETTAPGAPRLHLRHAQPDTILMVEVLMEQDYRCLESLSFTPASILDIGGNIGLGSFYLKSLFPKAEIIGFEPSPAEFEMLTANYAEWPDCRAFQNAIGDVDGAHLRFAVHPDRTGGQHVLGEGESGDWQEIQVTARRVDCLIQEGIAPVPDLVKMDIEGAEVMALRGFGSYLSKVRAFVLETHSAELHAACIRLLTEAGHTVLSDVSRSPEARILFTEKRP